MHLCVGAASRRVVEEAAKLQVHQIVASRRQVDIGGGYIGFDQWEFATIVRDLSGGRTQVVRDHGGPMQGGKEDDGTESFDADVAAGFDALHVDVSKIPVPIQCSTLRDLLLRYGPKIKVEIGGEEDRQSWLDMLVSEALMVGVTPSFAVVETGLHIWADRQEGRLRSGEVLRKRCDDLRLIGIRSKSHNADWFGRRKEQLDMLDAYNVAPEFAKVEVDAILAAMTFEDAELWLNRAYDSGAWTRWFRPGEGTYDERARCAMRYLLEDVTIRSDAEEFVRERIRDAIACG